MRPDEFATLRHRLYEEHGAFASETSAQATRAMYAALLGAENAGLPGIEAVRFARLLADGAGGEAIPLAPLLEQLGTNPYLDRYLADAWQRGRQGAKHEAGWRLAEAADSADPARLTAALKFAGELGLSVFSADRVLPLLEAESPGPACCRSGVCGRRRDGTGHRAAAG